MKCIFCKQSSESSKSVEHIIPESLGNTEHILSRGIVCDKCNNYFALKIEKKLLGLPYFISLRYRNDIKNKKGRVPPIKGILIDAEPTILDFYRDNGENTIHAEDKKYIEILKKRNEFSVLIPIISNPPEKEILISKFLGKVGIEALAKIGERVDGGLDEIINKLELDPIRNYVRYGTGIKYWDYYCRPLYQEDNIFLDDSTNDKFQVLHEYKLLYTNDFQLLIVVAIMGFEYCLDLGNPTIESYENWLKDNNNISPLYNKL